MNTIKTKTVKQSLFSFIKFFIGWPLSLTALYFVGVKTISQLQNHPINLSELSYSSLLFASIFYLLYFFLRGYIWQRELFYLGYKLNTYESIYHWAASELKRYIPGNIWSFLGRGIRFGEKGVSKKDIVTSLILEAQLIVLGAFVISLPSVISFVIPHISFLPPQLLMLIIILLSFSFLSAFFYQNVFYKYLKFKFIPMIFSPLSAQKHMSLLFLSSISYLFFGLGFYFSVISFIHIPNHYYLITVSGLVLAYLLGYLSIITPSGLGVRELIASLVLSAIANTSVVSFAVLFSRIFQTIIELIFVGISYLLYKKSRT
jgi:uncharacterized membrane protein YbhN (UPF0104 family)